MSRFLHEAMEDMLEFVTVQAMFRAVMSEIDADRDRMIAKYLQLLKRSQQLGPDRMAFRASTAEIPNRSYPIIDLSKSKMVDIDHILKAGQRVIHKDKFLLCRSILPVIKANMTALLVDDPNGELALHVSISDYSTKISPGSILAIMHPVFKFDYGIALIAVANPKHVQVITGLEPFMEDMVWKAPLPIDSGLHESDDDEDPALEGNSYFAVDNYPKALEAYTTAIEKHPKMAKLYANRALIYLKLDKPKLVLQDAEIGLKLESNNFKLLYRKGKALTLLKQYDKAVGCLEFALGKCPEAAKNDEFKKLLESAKAMRHEFKTGKYDLMKMINESKKSKVLENHADYCAQGLFELKEIEKKGRGLVAKKKIQAGTLLMASKAFVFIDLVAGSNGPQMVRADPLVKKVSEELAKNPELADDFYKLYAGEKLGTLAKADPEKLIDMDRIKRIVQHNAIGVEEIGLKEFVTSGVWIPAAYLNHSCSDSNCVQIGIGDFIFVRAKKDIDTGDELLISYIGSSAPFEERSDILRRQFGFRCDCELCKADRAESTTVRRRFEAIKQQLDEIRGRFKRFKSFAPSDAGQLAKMLEEVREYRPNLKLNYLAMDIQKGLAAALFLSNPAKSMQLEKECFEVDMSTYEIYSAIYTAKRLVNVSRRLGQQKEAAKWGNTMKKLARIMFGDERLEVMIKI